MDTYLPAARPRRGIPRSSVALALATLLAAAIGQVAMAAQPEVPGNNGTVKIHEGAGEPASEVRNEPHVCTFHLHFFFADAGDSGTWEIQEWSPGDKGKVVLEGEYTTDTNGEDRDPDAGTYSLLDGHYKLFWDGDLDTNKHDKHKVFWVECEDQGNVAPPTNGGGNGGGGNGGGGGGGGDNGGGTAPTEGTAPTPPGGGVAPTEGTAPTPPSGGTAPTEMPTPAGGVAAATATPAVTLPPTDTADQPTAGSGALWAALLFLFAVATAVALATVPVAVIQRGRRR